MPFLAWLHLQPTTLTLEGMVLYQCIPTVLPDIDNRTCTWYRIIYTSITWLLRLYVSSSLCSCDGCG